MIDGCCTDWPGDEDSEGGGSPLVGGLGSDGNKSFPPFGSIVPLPGSPVAPVIIKKAIG
jgi:hypothetical protein